MVLFTRRQRFYPQTVMKISYKHWSLLILVSLALISLFLPMLWEKDLYPRHMRIHQRAVIHPQAAISQMPAFTKFSLHEQAPVDISAWLVQIMPNPNMTGAQLVQQLRQQGYASFLSSTLQAPTVAQVFVGPYSQEQAANAAKQSLHEQYHLNATVVSYNPTVMKEV